MEGKIIQQDDDVKEEKKDEVKILSKNESVFSKINEKGTRQKNKNLQFFLLAFSAVALAILVQQSRVDSKNEKYWVYSAKLDVGNPNGLLKHVHLVLNRFGFEKSTNNTPWTLLWSHDYPFRALYPSLHALKPHQRVNHFPGTQYITHKRSLATSDSKYIPKAFELPRNKEAFLKYAGENKNAVFLQKHNEHRGVILKNVSDIDTSSGDSFVQEYVPRPFLVDGHKFDIGVYVVLTSVNPLRAYWYKGDVLFRYCPEKYHPFDPANLNKYVIADDYLPTWEVPSLAHPYTSLGYSMKDSFDLYVRSQGKDPSAVWSEVGEAITDVLVMNEHRIVEALKRYTSPENFFELMRFDLILDEELRVYLLESNMSPNLSSAHFPQNQLLYEQVLYSLFSVTGISSYLRKEKITPSDQTSAQNMITAQKNIATWALDCSTECRSHCGDSVCGICRHCIPARMRSAFVRAHYEHLHRIDFRRLYPQATRQGSRPDETELSGLSEANRLQKIWYQGKCNADITWCT